MSEERKPSTDAKHRVIQPQFQKIEVGAPRPDHADFKTASELKAEGWSGVRHNSFTEEVEIFVDGKIVKILDRTVQLLNPNAIEEAFQEIFGLHEVKQAGKEK